MSTGNSHGDLLSGHKIGQACPGAPKIAKEELKEEGLLLAAFAALREYSYSFFSSFFKSAFIFCQKDFLPNPKSEWRKPKQIRDSKGTMFETRHPRRLPRCPHSQQPDIVECKWSGPHGDGA
jgi:hypothetical protein